MLDGDESRQEVPKSIFPHSGQWCHIILNKVKEIAL